MKHSVKIVIGANYGDEGKGLMSRYFTKEFINEGKRPITVLHNGSAQRGHTADYDDGSRHVFHNFATGSKEGASTYYASTFMVHPLDYCREVRELGYLPDVYCNPNCVVVTPLDMIVDHMIEDYIAVDTGTREYGSCGYGTWSTTDRIKQRPDLAYTVSTFFFTTNYIHLMDSLKEWCLERLKSFHVDLDRIHWGKEYFSENSDSFAKLCARFKLDLDYFMHTVRFVSFEQVWNHRDSIIFEGAQGLLLDKDQDTIWTTTSHTGLKNPSDILAPYSDFQAEVCYVTRTYITRHGDGPLDSEVNKNELGDLVDDKTNKFNVFQGGLRYATMTKSLVDAAIEKDFSAVQNKSYFLTTAYTHCNEHPVYGGTYRSYTPNEVNRVCT